jgi:hypothetical protein
VLTVSRYKTSGRAFAAIIAIATLSACVDTPTAAVTTPPGGGVPLAGGNPAPVSTARAVALFDAVCGGTAARNFSGAKQVMAQNGVTAPSPLGTTTMFSTTEDLSFKVAPGDTCSMVFGTRDSRSTVANAVKTRFGNPIPIGTNEIAMKDLKTGKLVIFDQNALTGGPNPLYHLMMYGVQ